MNLTTIERIKKSRIQALNRYPFFAFIMLGLKIREEKRVPTMGVDAKGNLYYNDEWVSTLTQEQLTSVVAHEALHASLGHLFRTGDRDHEVWNIAIDLVCNYILVKDNFTLPKEGIIPNNNGSWSHTLKNGLQIKIENIGDKSAEQIYSELYNQIPKVKVQMKMGSGTGQGEGQEKDGEQQLPKNWDEHLEVVDEKGNPVDLSKEEIKQLKDEWTNRLIDAMTSCFDDKTEILTENGWKLFKDLQPKEKVMTQHPLTKELSLQTPTDYIDKPYKGEMVSIKNVDTNLLVTRNHYFLVKKRTRNGIKKETFTRADQLKEDDKILRVGEWKEGNKEKQKIIPKYEHSWNSSRKGCVKRTITHREKTYSMKDYIELLGWYISEGYVNNDTRKRIVTLSQSKTKNPENYVEIEALLKRMKLNYSKAKDNMHFNIRNSQLSALLKNNKGSYNKFIPKEIKEMSVEYLKILLDTLIKGDGHQYTRYNCYYYTASERLANDVQEIAIKCGYFSKIKERVGADKRRPKNKIFMVSINKNKQTYKVKKKDLSKQYYSGRVYCVTVPNGLIVVRRNGKPTITSNSKNQGKQPSGMERYIKDLVEPEFNWRTLLYKYITNTQVYDYNMTMPSRKSRTTGIHLPSPLKESIDVIVAVDVSGSTGAKEYTKFISEIIAMAKSFPNIHMRFIAWDTSVTDDLEIANGNIEKIFNWKFKGGGGTTAQCFTDYINEKYSNTKLVVVLTDGYFGNVNVDEANYDRVWTLTKHHNDKSVPEGDQVIKMQEE